LRSPLPSLPEATEGAGAAGLCPLPHSEEGCGTVRGASWPQPRSSTASPAPATVLARASQSLLNKTQAVWGQHRAGTVPSRQITGSKQRTGLSEISLILKIELHTTLSDTTVDLIK